MAAKGEGVTICERPISSGSASAYLGRIVLTISPHSRMRKCSLHPLQIPYEDV